MKSGKYELAIILSIIAMITASIILPIDSDKSESHHNTNNLSPIEDVQSLTSIVHLNYLDCYALDEDSKATCVDKLNEKYILKRFWDNPDYLVSFQYQAEKLGFKHFINDAGKPCDVINEGPIFDDKEQRYIVKCESGKTYLMHFDYDKKEWQVED